MCPSAGRPSQRKEEERRDAVCAPGHAQGTTVTLFLLTLLYMYVYQKFNIKNVKCVLLNPATPLHDYGYSAMLRIDTSMR